MGAQKKNAPKGRGGLLGASPCKVFAVGDNERADSTGAGRYEQDATRTVVTGRLMRHFGMSAAVAMAFASVNGAWVRA